MYPPLASSKSGLSTFIQGKTEPVDANSIQFYRSENWFCKSIFAKAFAVWYNTDSIGN